MCFDIPVPLRPASSHRKTLRGFIAYEIEGRYDDPKACLSTVVQTYKNFTAASPVTHPCRPLHLHSLVYLLKIPHPSAWCSDERFALVYSLLDIPSQIRSPSTHETSY